jgi:hypothetical protein
MNTFDALRAPLCGAVISFAVIVTGCSGRSSAADAQASAAASGDVAAVAVATSAPVDAGSAGSQAAASTASDASDATAAPVASAAPAAPAAGGTCPLIATAQVEAVMHLTVQSVEVKDDASACTFHFKNGDNYADIHGDLDVEYHDSGGPDEVNAIRTAAGGVKSLIGAIAGAASAPPGAAGALTATAPPGVPKVGDDQAFMNAGMATKFCATKGDAYAEVDGGIFAQGVSGWTALPQIASDILASR